MTERCCYDDPGNGGQCPENAEWELWLQGTHPSEVTAACTRHVGELLSDGTNYVWPLEQPGARG